MAPGHRHRTGRARATGAGTETEPQKKMNPNSISVCCLSLLLLLHLAEAKPVSDLQVSLPFSRDAVMRRSRVYKDMMEEVCLSLPHCHCEFKASVFFSAESEATFRRGTRRCALLLLGGDGGAGEGREHGQGGVRRRGGGAALGLLRP